MQHSVCETADGVDFVVVTLTLGIFCNDGADGFCFVAGFLLFPSFGGPFPQSFYTRMRKIPMSVPADGGFIRIPCGIFMRRAQGDSGRPLEGA